MFGLTIEQELSWLLETTLRTKRWTCRKHLTVKVSCRFLQECVRPLQLKITMISCIKTNKNCADIMTKQSAGPQFTQCSGDNRRHPLRQLQFYAGSAPVFRLAGVWWRGQAGTTEPVRVQVMLPAQTWPSDCRNWDVTCGTKSVTWAESYAWQ